MLEEAQKAHNKAAAKMYKLLKNLLSGDLQSQWDPVCRKMHEGDLWAGVNGQMPTGRRPYLWTAFQDCLEQHMLTVFTADVAESQWLFIQQAVHKPQRTTVLQHISQMGVLNDYVGYLLRFKDGPNAVPTTKKENIPFGKANLATIMLASVPMTWQNQYNLTHLTVPELTHALLLDLEAFERVMVKKRSRMRSSRQRVSLLQPVLTPRVIPSGERLGAQVIKSLKRLKVRSFACVAKPMAAPTRPTSSWTALIMTAMVSPSWQMDFFLGADLF